MHHVTTPPRVRRPMLAGALIAALALPTTASAQARSGDLPFDLETSTARDTGPADVAEANAMPYRVMQSELPAIDTDGGIEAMEIDALRMPYYVVAQTPTATVPGALETAPGAATVNANAASIPPSQEGISGWAWAAGGVGLAAIIGAALLLARRRPEPEALRQRAR